MLKKTLILASIIAFAATSAVYACEGKPCDCGCKKSAQCEKKFDGKFDEAKKAEFEQKRAEFESRLKLTDEQKAQAKVIREKGRADAEAIIKKLEAKKAEFEAAEKLKLAPAAKEAKLEKIRTEKAELKEQLKNLHKANFKEFEAILTPKQQKELTKLKQEGRKKFEEKKKADAETGKCSCSKNKPEVKPETK